MSRRKIIGIALIGAPIYALAGVAALTGGRSALLTYIGIVAGSLVVAALMFVGVCMVASSK